MRTHILVFTQTIWQLNITIQTTDVARNNGWSDAEPAGIFTDRLAGPFVVRFTGTPCAYRNDGFACMHISFLLEIAFRWCIDFVKHGIVDACSNMQDQMTEFMHQSDPKRLGARIPQGQG